MDTPNRGFKYVNRGVKKIIWRPIIKNFGNADSNHTHNHVLRELEIYSRSWLAQSYLIVFDSYRNMPASYFDNRPWDVSDNPMTAVKEFLKNNGTFIVDTHFDDKLIFSVAPQGYLKKIK